MLLNIINNMELENLNNEAITNKFIALIKEQGEDVESILGTMLKSLIMEDGEVFAANKNQMIAYMKDKLTMSNIQLGRVKNISPTSAFKGLDELNVFEFKDDLKQIIKEHEETFKPTIEELYPEKCKTTDLIILMSIWSSYYLLEPKVGNLIDDNKILDVSNDGVAYFINFVK